MRSGLGNVDGSPMTHHDEPTGTAALSGPIDDLLADLYERLRGMDDGDVATYIPELARADAADFAVSLTTLDGHSYAAGQHDTAFTIQSVSKPFVYALALADRGLEYVTARVGVEPTGDPFNSITVDEATGRPFNPMVNAGAIVTASLVAGDSRAEQFERIHSGLSAFAGRPLEIDQAVYESELATGHRNRAIGYLMRTVGALEDDVDAVLDVYFRQCAILVTVQDLSMTAATLANGGVNPVTGVAAMRPEHVERVLTVMATCGMYDYAGEWLFRVGLPAKSGVSGGIVAVLPGQVGIGLYGPRLDERGNSVRGIAACEQLSDRLGLHVLRPKGEPPAAVRRSYRGDVVRSKRARTRAQRELLDQAGRAVIVHEVQGDQGFASAEELIRTVRADLEQVCWVLFDVRRVSAVDSAASVLFVSLAELLARRGIGVLVADPRGAEGVLMLRNSTVGVERFHDVEGALEWCENRVLADAGEDLDVADRPLPLAEQELLAQFSPGSIDILEQVLVTRVFTAGVIIFDEGDEADALFFVSAGQVSIDLRVGHSGRRTRLASVGAGGAFGEMSLIDGGRRSSRVVAELPTLCHVLSAAALASLQDEHPDVAAQLYRGMARGLSATLRRSTAQIRVLER